MSLSRPATFPLLKLPWLCIKCVIQNSDLFNVIFFATISNRARTIVKNSKYPLKKITVFPNRYRTIRVGDVLTDRRTWYFIHDNKSRLEQSLVLKRNSEALQTDISSNCITGHYLYSFTVGDELDALKMGIEFMFDVFGCTIEQLYVYNGKLAELLRLGISSVEELFLSGSFNITDLKYLLENIKVTDKYLFYVRIPKNFYSDPRIFKCRQLFFGGEHSADWVTLELLCQFDVPQLFFMHHRFSIKDIVSYMTYWFKSENRKLEYLFVSFKRPVSQDDFKIDQLNPMPFCEKRRNRCPLVEGWKNEDMSGGMDILRQDGLLATLFVKPDSILFYIWHKRFPIIVQHK
ncbi:unnamed protein product [Caenorhabditis brenneri]